MKYETDRFICQIHNGIAHVCFKSAEVVEYSEAVQIGAELRRMIGTHDFNRLVIDFEALRFITSTVLEALVSVYLRCKKLGRQLRVVHADPLIRETLRTTQLDRIIPVMDTLDDALEQ